ncbi:hypothetical protein ZWY2020_020285 [Hordeum vulgare]|nr:hypothetical protein ZWY2020_020285 [Hordeum vulgare]
MSSADELFHNSQIRPYGSPRCSSVRRRSRPPPTAPTVTGSRRCKQRLHWTSAAVSGTGRCTGGPAQPHHSGHTGCHRYLRRPRRRGNLYRTPTSASRSSSSSSSGSSSASKSCGRWRFLKKLIHPNRSDGSKHQRPLSPACPKTNSSLATPNKNPTPAAGKRGRRSSAHERLYEARRAEAEDMRRRTFLPYRQALLLGCLGFGSPGYSAMHGFAAATTAKSMS